MKDSQQINKFEINEIISNGNIDLMSNLFLTFNDNK